MKLLSFLLPTRNRFTMLKDSIISVFEKASNPHSIEVLIAMDDDDTTFEETVQYINESPYKDNIKLYKYERYGYKNLHLYINNLCSHATGKYLVLWNDDAKMVSDNYDTSIRHYIDNQDKLYVYQFENNHCPYIFPVVPRQWFEILGHFSLNAHNDTWIHDLATKLGVNKVIGIYIWHLRGEDNSNSIYKEVDNDYKISSPDFFSTENANLRKNDTDILRAKLYI
jgi:hypothetical protein